MSFINITNTNGEQLKFETNIKQKEMQNTYNEIFNHYYAPTQNRNTLIVALLNEFDQELQQSEQATEET